MVTRSQRASLVCLLSLLLSAVGVSSAGAIELKCRPWPLTDQSYAAIDPAAVRVENYTPETLWLEQVAEHNPSVAKDVTLRPIATIDVNRLYQEEDIQDPAALVQEARNMAARVGANAVYLDKKLMQEQELDGMRFIAYRVEYKHHLISPTFLTALPEVAVSPLILEEQLAAWEMSHFGKVIALSGLKTGAYVRVLLRDGSDLKGDYTGTDEDNRLWIHPQGWTGFFRDKAIPTANIQSVALLSPKNPS